MPRTKTELVSLALAILTNSADPPVGRSGSPASINSTGKEEADGSFAVHIGGCDGKRSICIPLIMGWKDTVRLQRSHKGTVDGTGRFPGPQPVK